jgi:hypothetical protein
MGRITVGMGIFLIVLGVGGYGLSVAGMLSGKTSWTALIPAFAGVLFLILGALAVAKPQLNKHLMHVAATLALLAFVFTVGGIVKLIRYGAGNIPPENARPFAWIVQGIMAVTMLIFIVLCVRSFIAARRAREAAAIA